MINKKGYSLIEVIVVISIIAIILGVSVPVYTKWLAKYRIRSAARDVCSVLNNVKMSAVKENNDWAVTFDSSTNSYTVYSSQGSIPGWNNGDEVVQKTVNLNSIPGGIKMLGPSGETPVPMIVFTASGTCNPSGNIYITGMNNPVYYRIQVTMPGSISLKTWTGSSWY